MPMPILIWASAVDQQAVIPAMRTKRAIIFRMEMSPNGSFSSPCRLHACMAEYVFKKIPIILL
jgi:hypothetical protein